MGQQQQMTARRRRLHAPAPATPSPAAAPGRGDQNLRDRQLRDRQLRARGGLEGRRVGEAGVDKQMESAAAALRIAAPVKPSHHVHLASTLTYYIHDTSTHHHHHHHHHHHLTYTYPSSGRTFGLNGAIGVRSSGARWFESDFTENS